ncbi:MAG: peptide ABC transporter substrate-binding protein [Candidatus Promineifilaceae bacterium]
MCLYKKYLIIAPAVLFGAVLLIGCRNEPVEPVTQASLTQTPTEIAAAETKVEVTTPVTVEVTRIVVETEVVEVTPEPESTAQPPKELVVCLAGEPQTLYPYGSLRLSLNTTHLLQAIYENMYTTLSFDYQARGIEKLPNLADGDATLVPVQVNGGDVVLDVNGDVVTLRNGITVQNAEGEAVEFSGEPLMMLQLSAEFTLKPLVWSDGTPVTADDSVYSFELAADANTPVPKLLTERTARYEATGERTLIWQGIPGYLDRTYFTNIWAPYPRHYWGGLSASELLSAEQSSRLPLSDGPYVVAEWVAGDHIRLTRNDYYYLAEEGLPRIDAIQVRFIPNADQLLAQLLDGQCDIGTHDALGIREAGALLEAGKSHLLEPYFQDGSVFEHVDFGINSVSGYATIRPDWFEDVRVRQAFVMCTDRQRMIDDLFFGQATIMDAYVPTTHPLYPDDATSWPYDVARANALLDEAGYYDTDNDGIREDPATGTPFDVTLLSTIGSELGEDVASMLVENLAVCGIQVEPSFLQGDAYFADGPDGPLFGRQFDLAAFPWLISIEPNCGLYLTSQIPAAENNWSLNHNNETGFSNPDFDAACHSALNLLPGMEGYEANHQAALRIWTEQVPSIPLFLRPRAAATTLGVFNFSLDPTQESELWNLYEIDIVEP